MPPLNVAVAPHAEVLSEPVLTTSLSLNGGTLHLPAPAALDEEVAPGLKLVLMLSGRLSYRLDDQAPVAIAGPAFHLSVGRDTVQSQNRFEADALRYVAVRMPWPVHDDALGEALRPLFELADGRSRLCATFDQRAGAPLQAIARQMLACPLQGAVRRLYLSGKALELTASAMEQVLASARGGPAPQAGAARLSSRDTRCLQQARELLLHRLQDPPTLPQLAREVGINVTKLTGGFRQLFGHSVYGFVREQRMAQAYRLLSAGEISVAEAAWSCGYSDSHFTKVFHKRYGVRPSDLH